MNRNPSSSVGHFRIGFLALVIGVALLGATTTVPLQAQAPGVAETEQARAQRWMTDRLIVMSRMVLGQQGQEPRPDQIVRASTLLELARQFAPQDPDLLRQYLELARFNEDVELELELVTQLSRYDPSDLVAQRDALLLQISQPQSVSERLDRLARLLTSPQGSALDDSVRADLSARGAVWADQMGDEPLTRRLLSSSIELDPSNLTAADLLVTRVTRDGGSAADLGVALTSLLRADPARPQPRIGLAAQLAQEAVYGEAATQFDMSARVGQAWPDPQYLQTWAGSLVGAGRSNEALALIAQYEQAMAVLDPPQELSMDTLLLRQVAARSAGAAVEAELFNSVLTLINDRIAEGQSELAYDRAWIAAMFGPDPADAARYLQGLDADDPVVRRAQAWIDFRSGNTEAAEAQFRAIGGEDRAGLLGLALMQPPARAEAYLKAIIKQDPLSLISLFGCHELHELDGTPEPTDAGLTIQAALNRIPRRMVEGDPSLLPWTRLDIQVRPARLSFLDPMVAVISLRNMVNTPLGIGESMAVPGLAMIEIDADLAGRPLPSGTIPPIFVPLNRQLTLGSGQTLEVPVRLDRTFFGQLASSQPLSNITFSASVIIDPRVDQQRMAAGYLNFLPGTFGGTDVVRNLIRSGEGTNPETLERDLARLDATRMDERMLGVSRLGSIEAMGEGRIDEATQMRIRAAIDDRFESWPPALQAWTIFSVPSGEEGRNRYRRVFQTAERSEHPLVRVAYLLTQVTEDNRDAANAALRADNESIREFAQAMLDALDWAAEQQDDSAIDPSLLDPEAAESPEASSAVPAGDLK